MSSGVQAGAGQLVKGWGEQGAEASAGARVGKVDGARSQDWRVRVGSPSPAGIVSSFFSGTVLTTRLLTCCILIRWPASIGTVARAIALVRQDDPPLLIDQRVDQHPLEEDLVEQLLQVGGRSAVEAVAVFEEVKSLGEVLADFGSIGLVGGQLALNLA